jgi:phage/plasmid-like protein (TIGR03299 family)
MSYLNRTLPHTNAFGTVDISSATSVHDALSLSGMDWKVDSRPIFDVTGKKFPNYVANVRQDTDELLGIVTDRYRIVQNEEAFEFVNNLSSEGFEFESAGVFKGGRSTWLMGHLPEETILGDDIANNLVFVNSHDGSSGVKVMMTPVRVICYNMLNLALRRANRSWSTKHTTSIYSKLEEAQHTLGLAQKYMDELKIEADRLANITITDNEIEAIFDKMFPVDPAKDSARKIRNVSTLKDGFIKCYDESDIRKFKGTVYGAINAMADLVDHKAPARVTANYYENNWNRLINGHSMLDTFYRLAS